MAPFDGFPDDSRYTFVPNLLFSSVLEEVDDPVALKCFLRALWLHSQKKVSPALLTLEDLLSDQTLTKVVSASAGSVEAALDRTARLGLLIHLRVKSERGVFDVYAPNTLRGRRDVQRLKDTRPDVEIEEVARTAPEAPSKPNIFSLYEENIGIIAPLMAEQLKDAERQYPEGWIEEAFRQAVASNKRSWRYIEAVLSRWKTEGKDNGEPWGQASKIDAREWIRRHGLTR